MEKVVIIVKDGLIEAVYGNCPNRYDVEILNLDTTDPDVERVSLERLQVIEQYLSKIY
ncbi:MAG: hypothetical protein IJO56_10205 [Oscillospiraceae bacterium]|nr:hypothetical protein [Oscillospiraceae bacterium]